MKVKLKLLLLSFVFVICSTGLTIYAHQKSAVNDSHLPKSESIAIGHGLHMEFALIPSGTFTMGSSMELVDGDEAPEHQVAITKPFYLGKYEVTQEQWVELMGSNPSKFKGDKRPVDSVSWEDAQRFLLKLKERSGRSFTLPTEAEWEYTARAGTTTKWFFGNKESYLGDYAWFGDNAKAQTQPVGQKKPNAWGLYDIYGNVQEWCKDWYANPYKPDDVSDPQGPNLGESRILRGGAWGDDFTMVRSAYRNTSGSDSRTPGSGFRVKMVID